MPVRPALRVAEGAAERIVRHDPRARPRSRRRRRACQRASEAASRAASASASRPASIRFESHSVRQSTSTTRPGRASCPQRLDQGERLFAGRPARPAVGAMAERCGPPSRRHAPQPSRDRAARPRRLPPAPAHRRSCPSARRRGQGRSARDASSRRPREIQRPYARCTAGSARSASTRPRRAGSGRSPSSRRRNACGRARSTFEACWRTSGGEWSAVKELPRPGSSAPDCRPSARSRCNGSAVSRSFVPPGAVSSSTSSVTRSSTPSSRARSPPLRGSGGVSAVFGSTRQSGWPRPRRSRCSRRARRAAASANRADSRSAPSAVAASMAGRRSTVLDAIGREALEQKIVFGRLARRSAPRTAGLLIDGRRVRRRCDEKADALPLELVAFIAREHVDRLGDALVAHDEAGALPHRLLAEIEHAPVPAHSTASLPDAQHRLGQVLVGADHRAAHAEMILEIGVDGGRKRQPSGARSR